MDYLLGDPIRFSSYLSGNRQTLSSHLMNRGDCCVQKRAMVTYREHSEHLGDEHSLLFMEIHCLLIY